MNEDIGYAEVVEDKPKIAVAPKQLTMEGLTSLKKKSQSAINGALIGLGIGLVYAMYKGKSKLIFSVLGSIGGLALGSAYHNFINEENDNKSKI